MKRRVGQLGEDVLRMWAAQIDAPINKADIDRTGWDFLMEFGIDADDADRSRPLDRIPVPPKCLIQVKSTDGKKQQVRASLANWRHLVQATLPAFFLLLRFKGTSECKEAYLIHVGETLMRRTLERLRSISAEVTQQNLGRHSQTYIASTDELLSACDGAALATAIHRYVQPDIHTYVEKKLRLLKTLGYERASVRLDATIKVPDPYRQGKHADLLVDWEIGTVKELEVTHGTITDVRFGIAAQQPDAVLAHARLGIERAPARSGRLTLRSDATRDSVILPCDMYEPLDLVAHVVPGAEMKIRLSVPGSDFVFNARGGMNPFRIHLPESDKPLPLNRLHSIASLIRFLDPVIKHKGSCSVHFDGEFITSFIVDGDSMPSRMVRWARIIHDVKEVVDRTGIPDDVEVEWRNLRAQEKRFWFMRRCFANEADGLALEFTVSPPFDKTCRVCTPLLVRVTIGRYTVVWSVLFQGTATKVATPTSKVSVPLDSAMVVDRWVLFEDEPEPAPASNLLDDAVSRCDQGSVVLRFDHGTADG